ncbi:decarboxylating 6-phosphogluconate dehydrogenase [Firmicutes bacterium AM41-11]|nr:decarboxylating 6-phosphogluconate dehydrogenase [Firmicutes bacterium AM41-11]
MKIGVVGLGKMGSNIAHNLLDNHVEVVGYDINDEVRKSVADQGIDVAHSLDALFQSLPERKIIWLMVPCGKATEDSIQGLKEFMQADDILIDAGNSNFHDSIRHAQELKEIGIHFLDVGTSGGVSGARNGACLMVGGNPEAVAFLESVFKAIAQEDGYLHTGEAGSGHFLKMVHNGIEYGMMEAIAEGFHVLHESNFDYNLEAVAKNWNHGSVIRSWLMELAEQQFGAHADLADIKGVVDASGEAKWTVESALDFEVPVPVIALSLMVRNASKQDDNFACKVLSVLRNGFGGHSYEKK